MKNTVIKYKKFISTLFSGVYIFAVLLSGYFHTHTNVLLSSGDGYVDLSHASAKTTVAGGADSCYVIHASQVLIGDIFAIGNFEFYKPISYKENHTTQYQFSLKENLVFFSLRAPPYFI